MKISSAFSLCQEPYLPLRSSQKTVRAAFCLGIRCNVLFFFNLSLNVRPSLGHKRSVLAEATSSTLSTAAYVELDLFAGVWVARFREGCRAKNVPGEKARACAWDDGLSETQNIQ